MLLVLTIVLGWVLLRRRGRAMGVAGFELALAR